VEAGKQKEENREKHALNYTKVIISAGLLDRTGSSGGTMPPSCTVCRADVATCRQAHEGRERSTEIIATGVSILCCWQDERKFTEEVAVEALKAVIKQTKASDTYTTEKAK
jgi:hypothetical protein